jgi:putative flippase GtrA
MQFFYVLHNRVEMILGERIFHLIRYVISGGTAGVTNLIVLFLLVQYGNIHYLTASVLAYTSGIVVSFTLQKFWTFQDRPTHDVHAQFMRYITIVLANLALNTALMYLLVTHLDVWYLFAQMMAIIVIAITGYLGYKHFVFVARQTD